MPSTADLFRDVFRSGPRTQLSLAQDKRYANLRFFDLSPASLVLAISSLDLSQQTTEGDQASLYLFLGSSPVSNSDFRRSVPHLLLNMRASVPFMQDFHGEFLRLTLPSGNGSFTVDDLRTRQFNDKTTSVMLVDRWKHGKEEKTISARSTLTLPWVGFMNVAIMGIQAAVKGVAISAVQDPLFTWAAFPRSATLTDSDVYMVVSQWLLFHASGDRRERMAPDLSALLGEQPAPCDQRG